MLGLETGGLCMRLGEHGDVEYGGVGGGDGAAIREHDGDAWVSGALVEAGGVDVDEVAGGTGVGDACGCQHGEVLSRR